MNIKNENGITILALVVTMVVMIILASIAISASVGDNGLIKQAEAGTIKASIAEVEEALDAYILLKEKDLIRGGNLSDSITLSGIFSDGSGILLSVDTTTESGYNIYTIDISKLNIKGDYGKGTTTDVFKVRAKLDNENSEETGEYEVFYISSDGTKY